MLPRYPVYIPSKGRAEYQRRSTSTAGCLARDGIPFRVVVEPQEAEAYAKTVGENRVLATDFSNLGEGVTPARNWIRAHAEGEGHARHWQLDDNIIEFRRLWRGRRIPCHAGVALRVCEDLTDRYENVGVAGLNYQMFIPADTPTPFYRNVHVYSCVLVDHALPYWWRLRGWNEDTDLCLQALSNGWATLALNGFMANKTRTMVLAGGNTKEHYDTGENGESATDTLGRYQLARTLEEAWPGGIVRTVRRFGRYQHSVNWGAFREIPFRSKAPSPPGVDEYGLSLRPVGPIRSERLSELLAAYPEDVASAPVPEDWGGLPAFIPFEPPPKLKVRLSSERDREDLIRRLGVTIAKKTGPSWSAWWPPRDREDLASLRFDLNGREPVVVARPCVAHDEPKRACRYCVTA